MLWSNGSGLSIKLALQKKYPQNDLSIQKYESLETTNKNSPNPNPLHKNIALNLYLLTLTFLVQPTSELLIVWLQTNDNG